MTPLAPGCFALQLTIGLRTRDKLRCARASATASHVRVHSTSSAVPPPTPYRPLPASASRCMRSSESLLAVGSTATG